MKKSIIGVVSLLVLAGCSSVEPVSKEIEFEEEVQAEEVSLDVENISSTLKTVDFSKEENSLHVEYETDLTDGTSVELVLNTGHPDAWGDKYDVLDEYVNRLSYQQVNVTVEDGLISYTYDDSYFNSLPLPSSMLYIIIRVPEIDYYFEDSYELKGAHNTDEIYAHYNQEKIAYKELEKNPSRYTGSLISYTGEVLQIQEEDGVSEQGRATTNTVLRLMVDGSADDVLYVTSQRWKGLEGVYSGDTITIYGELTGSTTYESVSGYNITLPSAEAIIYHK
ncbi:lipoprotein [Planococcus rifietoensis]|uniref:lipoprotein n=1 Tax=Planococcus rifietoensis TaxID=200991 RepID=UPI00384BEBAC